MRNGKEILEGNVRGLRKQNKSPTFSVIKKGYFSYFEMTLYSPE